LSSIFVGNIAINMGGGVITLFRLAYLVDINGIQNTLPWSIRDVFDTIDGRLLFLAHHWLSASLFS